MKRRIPLGWLGTLLGVALVFLPPTLLVVAVGPLLSASRVERCQLAGGEWFFGVPLRESALDHQTSSLRFLRGDGGEEPSVVAVPVATLQSRVPAIWAWILEREDGPILVGVPSHLRLPDGSTLRGDSLDGILQELPRRLRKDRSRLAAQVREAVSGERSLPEASEAWRRWLRRDDSTRVVLVGSNGRILSARISGIQQAHRPYRDGSGLGTAISRLRRFLADPPLPWGGGGMRPALAALLRLVAFAGLFSACFGISGALWMRGWNGEVGWKRWVRRILFHMAGVPGVVWGVAGAGLLIQGLGPAMDHWFTPAGAGIVWGGGGLLWSSVTLGAFATPIVMAQALEVLEDVPESWIDMFWTSGATQWQVVWMGILPHAWKGILAAILSGMARAAGETAPLLLTGAIRSAGGLTLGGTASGGFGLAGGYLHPGVLALDPPWGLIDAERGLPSVALSLAVLATLCMGLDLLAALLRRRARLEKRSTA